MIAVFSSSPIYGQYRPGSIQTNQEKTQPTDDYTKITKLYQNQCAKMLQVFMSAAKKAGHSNQEISKMTSAIEYNVSTLNSPPEDEIIKMAYFAFESSNSRYPSDKIARKKYQSTWDAAIESIKQIRTDLLERAVQIRDKGQQNSETIVSRKPQDEFYTIYKYFSKFKTKRPTTYISLSKSSSPEEGGTTNYKIKGGEVSWYDSNGNGFLKDLTINRENPDFPFRTLFGKTQEEIKSILKKKPEILNNNLCYFFDSPGKDSSSSFNINIIMKDNIAVEIYLSETI